MLDPEVLSPEAMRRFSRREYDALVALGMFEDERVELLRGVLVTMSPQGGAHATISSWLHQRLSVAVGMELDVRGHCPFAASEDSEPEPDVSVSPRVPGCLEHPTRPLLLIEVAGSSLRKDREVKAQIYAEAGAPEYWLVDISGTELVIAVHTDPTARGYRRVEVLRDGDVLRPTRLAGVAIAVRDVPWAR